MIVIPIAALAFAVALSVQWFMPGFSKWRYWIAVALVAVFGTMVADAIHVVAGVPYAVSTAGFGLALVVVFTAWHATEGTLSIHSITTARREFFYWAAVVTTFALGTAAGDLTASTLGLGYALSGVLFLALFLLPLVVRRLTELDEVATFWTSYFLFRPLGAAFAVCFCVGADRGGFGWGTGVVSAALIVVALAVVFVEQKPPNNTKPKKKST